MLNEFKDDVSLKLFSNGYSAEQIQELLTILEDVTYNYDITPKETQVIVWKYELPESAKKFLVAKKIKGCSELTLYNYNRFLSIFFQALRKPETEVTTEEIEYFLYWYQNKRTDKIITDRSLDKVLDCLKSYFGWCYARRMISFNPTLAIDSIHYEKKERVALTESELEMVRRACVTVREKAIVEVFYSTGCRVSELIGMKISDIDWDDRTVKVFGKGKKHRIAFLNVKAIFLLKDYLNTRTDTSKYLFVSNRSPHDQLHNCGVQKIIREIAKRTNLTKPLSCHIFRHTTATLMVKRGASVEDVMVVLGHENISTTLTYTHEDFQRAKATHERLVA